jgi:EpsI family protein
MTLNTSLAESRPMLAPIAVVAAVIAAIVLLFWPTWVELAAAWEDTGRLTYTHGWLIAALSLWLLWRERAHFSAPARVLPMPQRWLVVFALFAGALAWQFLYRAGIQIAQQMLLPLLMWLALVAVCGRGAARAAALPLALLYFAIPIWDYFNFAALWTTTNAVRLMLSVAGVPAFFDGNVVQIPSGVFEIAGGCSGMHYIIVALAVATLMGELRRDSWRMRVRWWVAALVLAVVINWVRVFTVIVAGHLSQMQHYLVRESHYGFGWALFGIVVLALIVMDRRTPLAPMPERVEAPANFAPASARLSIILTALALSLPLALNALISARVTVGGPVAWPASVSGCRLMSERLSLSDWRPQQWNSDQTRQAVFDCNGQTVELFGAWYSDQRQGKELGGYDNHLHGDAAIDAQSVASVGERQVASLETSEAGRRALLFVSYRVGDREFTSATRAQLWYSLETFLTLRSPLSAAYAARVRCAGDCSAAREVLVRFMNEGGIP